MNIPTWKCVPQISAKNVKNMIEGNWSFTNGAGL